MNDGDQYTRATRLRQREENVRILCTIVIVVPPLFTLLFLIASALTVVSIAGPNLDEAALAVAIVLAPCTALAWVGRHLILAVLDDLDLGAPTASSPGAEGGSSPRR